MGHNVRFLAVGRPPPKVDGQSQLSGERYGARGYGTWILPLHAAWEEVHGAAEQAIGLIVSSIGDQIITSPAGIGYNRMGAYGGQ